MPDARDIDTLVILMLENRSFDNVLGHVAHPKFGNRPDVEGLREDPEETTRYDNPIEGRVFKPHPTGDKSLTHDPPHDREGIEKQLEVKNGQATMRGFARSYREEHRGGPTRSPPLGFVRPKAAPVSGFLAAAYTVCDHWFSPLPTGTQPNRSMAFTGTSHLEDNVTGLIPHDRLLFDWLDARDVRWRVYHHGLPFFLLFGSFEAAFGDRFRDIRRLPRDILDEADDVPQVIVIEPEYEDSPVHMGFQPNDNHPPLPLAPGESLVHQVYAALTQNLARWAKTLLVVTCDEHGGFYDHVAPPEVRHDPPPGREFERGPFLRAGVRVPTLVASPRVARGGVCDATLDHTSVLQFLGERFGDGPESYSEAVTSRRRQGIESLSRVLTLDRPRSDLPQPPRKPITARTPMRAAARRPETDNQAAFDEAARACLDDDRRRALDSFPELATLPDRE